MKKLSFLVLLSVIASGVLTTSAEAIAPKPGAPCTKLNHTQVLSGYTYTCIRSGKTLIWKKGVNVALPVKVASPRPSLTPVSTPTPTPTQTVENPSLNLRGGLVETQYSGFLTKLNFPTPQNVYTGINFIQLKDSSNQPKTTVLRGFFVPQFDGVWKFSVWSTDSSYLFLGKQQVKSLDPNDVLVDNSGIHPLETISSRTILKKGDVYPFLLFWATNASNAELDLEAVAPDGFRNADLTGMVFSSSSQFVGNQGISSSDLNSNLVSDGVSYDPFQSLLNLNATRDETANRIQQIISNALSRHNTFSGTLNWYFQGNTDESIVDKTKMGLINAINFYQELGFTPSNAQVINARDMSWLSNQLTQLHCAYGNLPNNPGFYVPSRACDGGHGAVTASYWDVSKTPDGIGGVGFQYILPHEYFHQIQEDLSAPVGNGGPYPLWFWEGGANFFSILAYSSWHPQGFYDQWMDTLFKIVYPDWFTSCQSVNVFDIPGNVAQGKTRTCGYSKGAHVVEFFVGKFGVQKYIDLLKYFGSNPNSTFDQGFQAITNEALDSFYSEANDFLMSRGWNL